MGFNFGGLLRNVAGQVGSTLLNTGLQAGTSALTNQLFGTSTAQPTQTTQSGLLPGLLSGASSLLGNTGSFLSNPNNLLGTGFLAPPAPRHD